MKTVNKKLNLKKEQIAKLNEAELSLINGGVKDGGCIPTDDTCVFCDEN